LGVTKLRIAQINTTIGVIKSNIKSLDPTIGGSTDKNGGVNALEQRSKEFSVSANASPEEQIRLNLESAKLKKIAATWMDGISK
jgi:hypothetical protein